jgi:hypothetical protein
MVKDTKRRPGRPRLTPEEKAQKARFSISASAELTKQLQQAADENSRDRNAEAVARLEASFLQPLLMADFGDSETFALCRIIGRMIHHYKIFEGDFLWEDAGAHAEMKEAISTLLDAFGPHGGVPEPAPDETAGHRRARSNLTGLHRMKQHGRQGDDSADAFAIEETLAALGKLAEKLEPKV